MNREEFEARISQIINETGPTVPRNGVVEAVYDATARKQQFDALEKELRDALGEGDAEGELDDILNMFLTLRGSLTRPNMAGRGHYH